MKRISEWVSGRMFRLVHGNNLVYNTCWEDPRLDKVALELTPQDNLLVITSAGCNALSYALTGLNHVYAVDMNFRQNALLDLKIAGIKNLDYETFFHIFGYGRLHNVKYIYRDKLRPSLPPQSQHYWDRKITKYFDSRRKSFYFCGTSGAFARFVNFYVDKIGKCRHEANALLAATSIEEQHNLWFNKVKPRLWSRILRFVVNRDTTLSMLGVPRAQRMQVEKHYDGKIAKFVEDCLDAVLGELPLADNYFWRVYATGHYTHKCCPEYLEEQNFHALQNGLVDKISVHTSTVEQFLRTHDVPISRFVLLDHMDWLSHHLYNALVSEWDAILQRATPDAKILWRSGGLRTEYIDTVPVTYQGRATTLGEILEFQTELAEELHKKDRVHTYGSFYIASVKK